MGKPTPVFDTTKKQCVAIGQLSGSCVEYAVYRIRPVILGEDGVAGIARE
jgi:hypothetical protein